MLDDAIILNGKRQFAYTKEYVSSEFRDIFKVIGKLPGGKYHIQLKPDAQSVAHPPRAVPEKKSLKVQLVQFRDTQTGSAALFLSLSLIGQFDYA